MLLYDADCRLCRFVARCLARLDRGNELAFLALQDEAAAPLLAALPKAERLASWRIAQPDGSLAGYGAGVPRLLEAMRLTRPLGGLVRRIPEPALHRAYGAVARRRGRLGRLVPRGPGPRRFP